jgi:hypothetical protein
MKRTTAHKKIGEITEHCWHVFDRRGFDSEHRAAIAIDALRCVLDFLPDDSERIQVLELALIELKPKVYR